MNFKKRAEQALKTPISPGVIGNIAYREAGHLALSG
jgi:hypothetical protein